MKINEYQKEAHKLAVYPKFSVFSAQNNVVSIGENANYVYPCLGLSGEVGELLNKIKKIGRDDAGIIESDRKGTIAYEIGDCMWYIAELATQFDLDLEKICKENIAKLNERTKKGTIKGSGDER